ncbi:MAG: LLM class flavin-dependent oxidoreductase [Actinomycetia bacterium]|nr:LLM class flavin-dependent oxidoreductase [Actinomycetes bacterium]
MTTEQRVQVDLHLTGDQVAIADMLEFGRLAEDAGLGGVWTAEAWRDSLVPLAGIATATTRIRVGTDVSQWTRTLPNMELAAADLSELSGGRFVLGLGTAPREWNEAWHGISYERPVQRMREYVTALRLMWDASLDNPVSFDGQVFEITDYVRLRGPNAEPVPIHIGATLSGMAELAGELANGVNFNVVLSSPYIRDVMLPSVARGAERSGRSLADLEIGVLVSTAVSDDRAEAFRWAKHQIAFYSGVATYFEPVMRRHGFANDYSRVREAFLAGDPFGAIELVTDEMVEALALAGTPEEVRRRLDRYQGVVDFVMIYAPTFLLGPDVVRAEHEAMIDAFAAG